MSNDFDFDVTGLKTTTTVVSAEALQNAIVNATLPNFPVGFNEGQFRRNRRIIFSICAFITFVSTFAVICGGKL